VIAGGAQANIFYVANQGSNTVSFVDTNTNSEANRVTVGAGPVALTVASSSGLEEVYSANGAEGTLSVIDSARAVVSLTIPVGGRPRGLATIGPLSLPSILVTN
jgi:YVTN family beta-propeller protein